VHFALTKPYAGCATLILLLCSACDTLFCRLLGLRSEFLGMSLYQLVSGIPIARKDLRQRQHIIVLIEKELSATLGPVGLRRVHVHHDSWVTVGAPYLKNRLSVPETGLTM
jgi:hypothetical protein